MLSTEQALPILAHKLLEDVVKEAKLVAGKCAKQLKVEVSKDVVELQVYCISNIFRDHLSQHRTKPAGPASQECNRGVASLDCDVQIDASGRPAAVWHILVVDGSQETEQQ